jgi:cytoskeletal protein RodZ
MKSEEKSSEEKPQSKKSWKSIELKPSFSFSPMTKWILTILILGVGVVLVVVFYAQEQSRNSDLKEEVGTASTTLIQNSLRRNATEDRLAAANLDLAVLVAKFPSAQQSMDVEEALFSAAADAGVSIASINCSEPKGQKVGESTYPAFAVSVSVTGDTEDCLTFVGRLGYWLPSASIDSVSLSEGDMSLKLNIFAGVNE